MGSPSKSAQIELNRTQGKQFEIAEGQKFKAKYPTSDTQITIETIVDGEPVKFRIDQMGYDKNGNLILQELKSSPTATLTKNQQMAWGKNLIKDGRYGILENGGIVKGRINETLFPGGFQIPANTKIEIIRPSIPFKDVEALKNLSKFTVYSGGITGIIQNVPTIFSNNTARKESAYVRN